MNKIEGLALWVNVLTVVLLIAALFILSGCADAIGLASAVICPIDQGVFVCYPPNESVWGPGGDSASPGPAAATSFGSAGRQQAYVMPYGRGAVISYPAGE